MTGRRVLDNRKLSRLTGLDLFLGVYVSAEAGGV